MKKTILSTIMLISIVLSACNHAKTEEENGGKTQKANDMKNLISIVEIPTADFARAVKFYQNILGVSIEETKMGDTRMGLLPGNSETVNVVLVSGEDYKTTADGAVLYLNAGKDLQPMLDKVAQNGGQVIVPKTEISPEMGHFALFIDTEGNRMGLHSAQ